MDRRIAAANLKRTVRLAYQLSLVIERLQTLFPLSAELFANEGICAEDALALDAFRVRFTDLQDMLGRTVFKTIAKLDEDETSGEPLTMRERIMLMEKRGLIDASQWQDIRAVRNDFTHEYPDEHEEKAENFNAAWNYSPILLNIAKSVHRYIHQKHDLN